MRYVRKSAALAVAAACALALGCDDGIVTETTAPAPSLNKSRKGIDVIVLKPGGGHGGGKTVQVEFTPTLGLFGGAAADYVAGAQPVKGSNGRNRINVAGGYSMSVAYSADDAAACDDLGARLSQVLGAPQPRQVDLEITVDKRAVPEGQIAYTGVVVNLTTVGDDGDDYFLTAGGGESIREEGSVTRIAKQGGFLRVRNLTAGETHGALCDGIVDFEFTVSK